MIGEKKEPGCGGLRTYDGPANSPDVFKHLVGERIDAAFQADDGTLWIVCSGRAFTVCSLGGGSPAYGIEQPDKVRRVVEERETRIRRLLSELRDMPGVKLP